MNPAFFIAPAMNPRTVCFCQPIFNLWRRLVLPTRIDNWSLTSLQQRLEGTVRDANAHARAAGLNGRNENAILVVIPPICRTLSSFVFAGSQ